MGNLPFDGKAFWIWAAGADRLDPGTVALTAQFRRRFTAPRGASLAVHVSADSRYVLRLNDRLIGRGPAKGDPKHWPYDRYDLGKFLAEGENELSALVVCFAPSWPNYNQGGAPISVMTAAPGFILDGKVVDETGATVDDLSTDRRWQAAACRNHRFVGRPGVPCAGPGEETLLGGAAQNEDAAGAAAELTRGVRPDTVIDSSMPHRLIPRRIPLLAEALNPFASAWDDAGFRKAGAGTNLLSGDWVEVAPGGRAEILLDAGAIASGYPKLDLEGTGIVRIFYGERLPSGAGVVRDASKPHEALTGPMFDQVRITGGRASWEPVFWRAFRFVRLEAEGGDTPLKLRLIGYTHTAYPYADLPPFRSSDPAHERMDEAAWRTLRLCSHETFEDCPYYEQLQYAGDVHIQARTAYRMAGDTALARQAMLHFAESVNDEGLTASRWPSRVPQLIPLWSLHWVMSIVEYHDYTGDLETVRDCLPATLRVLDWFLDRCEPEGLVGRLPYWKIADWCPQWRGGIPPGANDGATAIINFMTVAGLRAGARLCEAAGKKDEAARRRDQATELARLADRAFWSDASGLYRDRPFEPSEISQLTNAWAILSGVASDDRTQRIAEPMASRPDLCEAAWFGRCFLFDALVAAGRFDLAERLLEPFRALLSLGFTTWPEDPAFGRSECHGWSNLPGLAFRRLYLGVTIDAPGCRRVRIAPWPGNLAFAEGVVPLIQGPLRISWRRDGNRLHAEIDVPAGVSAVAVLPGGRETELRAGRNLL